MQASNPPLKIDLFSIANALRDESIIQQALPTFEMVLRYILSQTEIDKTAFDVKVNSIQSFDIKDIAMTLAQQFLQEGHQKGRQEGIWIGKIINLQELMGLVSVVFLE